MLQGNLKDCFTYAKLFCFVVSTRMEDSLLDWRRLIVANCTWPKESKRRGHMWRALPVNSACGSYPGTLNKLSYMGPTLPSVLGCPKGQQIFLAMIPISNEGIVPKRVQKFKRMHIFWSCAHFYFYFYFFVFYCACFGVLLKSLKKLNDWFDMFILLVRILQMVKRHY